MEALTPASPGDLPPLGEPVADEPLWRHPAWGLTREGVRICVSGRPRPIPRATWQLSPRSASEPLSLSLPGASGADLVRRYGPSLVLLEHHRAPELAEGVETLDLVRIGADGSPHWSRVWPTPEENPRHAALKLWMANYGHQIVDRPASYFDRCEDD